MESLETFLAVARTRSINKAADALFLAQSTVTHRLQRLEKELGVALFVRRPDGVELTPDGRRLMPVATSVVEQLRAFAGQSGQARAITLLSGRAFISYDLPVILGAYRRCHPEFTCYVKSALHEEAVNALLNGVADLAFLGSEVYHPQLCAVSLPSDRILLITAPEHLWAAGFPGFDRWGGQEVIAFGNGAVPFRRRVDKFLAEHGVFPNISMELDSTRAVQRMVMQNLGVAMLPWRTVRDEAAAGRLAVLDIAGGQFTRPTLLVYPRHRAADQQLQDLVRWIADHYPLES
ncbi:MAG TPA: LysR family transcriptional regulator [Symbiobacteriaceae bacterium]|jgi:DNA-binding transcriptional LysR family regulator